MECDNGDALSFSLTGNPTPTVTCTLYMHTHRCRNIMKVYIIYNMNIHNIYRLDCLGYRYRHEMDPPLTQCPLVFYAPRTWYMYIHVQLHLQHCKHACAMGLPGKLSCL